MIPSLRRLSLVPAAAVIAVLGLAAAGAQGSSLPGGASAAASTAGATGATGASGPSSPSGPLSALLIACHTDPVAANRYAIFESQTVAADVPGTVVMSVDLQLQARTTSSGAFVALKAPGFDRWTSSQPGVGILTDRPTVTDIPAPSAVRVFVRARWFGRDHVLLQRDSALSPVCVEPVLAPDLQVRRVLRAAGATTTGETYDVEVRNAGSAAAGPFQVSLEIGTTALTPVTVSGLAPDASTVAQFSGPRCVAGETLTAVADSSNAISEPPDARRTLSETCPVA